MNTIYKPVDREFLEMLAAAKARGVTWMRLAEMTKRPVVELEVIPWREPKAWAKACKYAEKLMHCETLSETLAQLRAQMNDNVNNARSKSQVANSMVRVIQLQNTLRTPKKPKKAQAATPDRQPASVPLSPIEPPTPTPAQPTQAQAAPPAPTPRELNVGRNTVAAALLLLFGLLAFWSARPVHADDSPTAIIIHEHNRKISTPEMPILLLNTPIEESLSECGEGGSPWSDQPRERSKCPVDSSPPTG